jgi:hypothetical protein
VKYFYQNKYVKYFMPKQLVCEIFYTKTTSVWNILYQDN